MFIFLRKNLRFKLKSKHFRKINIKKLILNRPAAKIVRFL